MARLSLKFLPYSISKESALEMPAWMHIDNDSTAERFSAALSFITEGRAVGFPGFSLAVFDGQLRIDIDYSSTVQDDETAQRLIKIALENFQSVHESQPEFGAKLSNLPRRVALVWTDGRCDVEIAKVVADKILWKASGN